jgi:hypothetical protein
VLGGFSGWGNGEVSLGVVSCDAGGVRDVEGTVAASGISFLIVGSSVAVCLVVELYQ